MKHLVPIFLIAALVACSSEGLTDQQRISELELIAFSPSASDEESLQELLELYKKFYTDNSQDSISPYYLMRRADFLQGSFQKITEALELYDQFINAYPKHNLTPRALFMKAFVYDENLNQKDQAITAYQELIASYPKHPLASDAQNLLTLLTDTLNPEERVEMWLEESKNDSLK